MFRYKNINTPFHLDMAEDNTSDTSTDTYDTITETEDKKIIQKTKKNPFAIGIIAFVSVFAVLSACLALVFGLQKCK